MAWTTRVIHIDGDTGEVLQNTSDYTLTSREIIYKQINPTHNERIIIKKYKPTGQTRINFK